MLAKLGKYFLLDADILPLQGLAWQTKVVSTTADYKYAFDHFDYTFHHHTVSHIFHFGTLVVNDSIS